MRKHFLLLFLLTLLPLAGFAEDLDMTKFTAANIQYGATALPTVSVADGSTPGTPVYAVNTDYTVSTEFYTDATFTTSKTVAELPTTGSGQYWLKITGQGTYAGQVYPLSFWIIGTDISGVAIANVNTSNSFVYTGTAFTPEPTVTYGSGNAAVVLQKDVHFTYSYSANKNVGTATITITGKGNYSGTATKTFQITKANLVPSQVTAAPTAIANLEYTGEAQVLVQDGTLNIPADNANVKFNYSLDNGNHWYVATANDLKQVNAGSYDMIWKVAGGTNYNDYVPTAPNNAVTGKIAQAMLIARAQNIETYYGKTLTAASDVTIKYEDYQGNVISDVTGIFDGNTYKAPVASFASSLGTQPFNQGTYTDGIVLTGGNAKNYVVVNVNATLKINKAKLKLTLMHGKTATFGTAAALDNSWQLTADSLYWDGDANSGVTTVFPLKLEFQDGENTYKQVTPTITLTGNETAAQKATKIATAYVDAVKKYLVVDATTKNITGLFMKANDNTSGAVNTEGYALTLEGGTAQDNYEIAERVSTQKLIISAAVLTIKAANKVKTYGTADPKLTYTVEGGSISNDMAQTIEAALIRQEGETAGNYTISFGETNPTFNGYNITWETGRLVIQKAALTITADEQSLYTANTIADLDQKAYDVTGLVTSANDATDAGINDAVEVELAFAPMVYNFTSWSAVTGGSQYATGTAKVVSIDATNNKTTIEVLTNTVDGFVGKQYTVASADLGTITERLQLTDASTNTAINVWVEPTFASGVKFGDAGKLVKQDAVANGIKVILKNEEDLLANYRITLVANKLTVVDLTETLVLNANDNTGAIEAADGTTVNVKFGDRELKRETWSVMVLPFKTSVTEVSKALGYAVVNIVDQSTSFTGNDLHLKLHMGAIEANQPFLVKYYKDDVPAVLFTADGAADYNAHLTGALNSTDALTPQQLTAYNTAMSANKSGDNVTLTPAEAKAYNAKLTGAVEEGDVKYAAIDYSTWNLGGRAEDLTSLPYKAAIAAVQSGAKKIVSGEAKDEDPRGNIFYGVYAPTPVYGHEYATTTKAGVIKRLGAFTADDPFTIVPTSGYFKMADQNARIFIEEPDGTTTVIKGINADGEAIVDNDGWYTLNGVKLQGAPTQKGIYINNGKKIVVK